MRQSGEDQLEKALRAIVSFPYHRVMCYLCIAYGFALLSVFVLTFSFTGYLATLKNHDYERVFHVEDCILDGCSMVNGNIVSDTGDPKLIIQDINSNVNSIQLRLRELSDPKARIQVFWEDEEAFCEKNSVLSKINQKAYAKDINIDTYVTDLRIDIGDSKNTSYAVDAIIVNPNLYDFLYGQIENMPIKGIIVFTILWLVIIFAYFNRNKYHSINSDQIISNYFKFGIIIILSFAISFFVVLISTEHSVRYDATLMGDSEFLNSFSECLDDFGFSMEVCNAAKYVGYKQMLFGIISALITSAAGFYWCLSGHRSRFLKRHHLLMVVSALAIIGIVCQLNGSSIFINSKYLSIDKSDAPIWGIARDIRSDEFSVWTPFAISQENTGFRGISPIIGGGGTNTTWISVGGLPAINKAIIFRPLYWGFLLFGSAYGLSILWILRVVILFFASYYCALIYTKKRKSLSIAAATMITLSPYVQWWFSQSIAEVIFYPELILLCIWEYIHTESKRKKVFLAVLTAWFFGCFCMISYLAWQIPMVYLTIAIIIMVVIQKKPEVRITDVLLFAVPIFLVLFWILLIVRDTWPTLNAVRNSVYPGERLYLGGDFHVDMYTGLYNIFGSSGVMVGKKYPQPQYLC